MSIVSYVRCVGPLFALVLAVASPVPVMAASATYDNPASHNAGTGVDRLLSVSVSNHAGQPADRVSTLANFNEPAGVRALVYTPEEGQGEQDEFSTVARHRGFRKFLLVVFICGAVIRFFTSPTFMTFITDALDPKSW